MVGKLAAKQIAVGVGAGIAAYKVTGLVRQLVKAGHLVRVLPTKASLEFVGKATWEALSGQPVPVDTFTHDGQVGHVEIARQTDLIILAPATADLLARLRCGLASEMLGNVILASAAPVLVAPAMHTNMWLSAATQDNVATLRARGYQFIGPDQGDLSSGDSGLGRLVEIDQLYRAATYLLQQPQKPESDRNISAALNPPEENHLIPARPSGQELGESKPLTKPGSSAAAISGNPSDYLLSSSDRFEVEDRSEKVVLLPGLLTAETLNSPSGILAGKNVLISAGGTREPLDPVRFLGNRSSGRFGCELAKACAKQGAKVTLLAANIESSLLVQYPGIKIVPTPRAADMYKEAMCRRFGSDLIIMAAAVADYAPARFNETKIKKETDQSSKLVLELEQTPDILAGLAKEKSAKQFLVGFAAETGDRETVLRLGKQKAQRKQADWLLINQVGMAQGFGDCDTAVYAVDSQGDQLWSAHGNKSELAAQIVVKLAKALQDKQAVSRL